MADLAQVGLALAFNLACVAVDQGLARVVADPIQAFAAKLDVDLHHLGRGHVRLCGRTPQHLAVRFQSARPSLQ